MAKLCNFNLEKMAKLKSFQHFINNIFIEYYFLTKFVDTVMNFWVP